MVLEKNRQILNKKEQQEKTSSIIHNIFCRCKLGLGQYKIALSERKIMKLSFHSIFGPYIYSHP